MTITPIQTAPTLTKTKRVPRLTLVLDPGTSCTKAIYCRGRRGQPKYTTISSLVYPASLVAAGASFVKLPDNEQYYLVGYSASQSRATVSIKQLKSESLIPKVLGTIGTIAKSESLPSSFKLNIKLLLPISEMSDRAFIETELQQALANFNYSGKDYQVEATSIKFTSEGRGIHSYLSALAGNEQINYETCAYLMFGYRNTSLLLFENGELNRSSSHSTDLGFYNYLDLVTKYGSGLYREDIQKAIVTQPVYGTNIDCKQVIKGFNSRIGVEDLIRSSSPKHRERERESIDKAITRADAEYWVLLSGWLREKLPPLNKIDRIVYCGGSTSFIETPLKEFFQNWSGSLTDTSQMSLKMMEKLEIPQVKQRRFVSQHLPIRLADAWGEFVEMMNIRL